VTHSRRDVLDLLDRHGLTPSRALGQNFVADANTVRRIAWLAEVGPGDRVIEVGAGLGSLTLALAETGADVTAVEVDRHVLPALREVVANLPYNIATPLVADLLDAVPELKRMLVMVQREVGERLAAHVGDDGYGAVSVKVDYWADARVVGHVPASVFVPRPNVESALVRIDRRAHPKVDVDPSLLFPLVRAGFGQRRKMLRRALADVVDADAFACAGVRPEARAAELDVDAWGRLARCVHRRS
jgi:16S rRNA (adenine1518-N6/adenine1519-N6)-dimethyltransferase